MASPFLFDVFILFINNLMFIIKNLLTNMIFHVIINPSKQGGAFYEKDFCYR